VTCLGTQVTHSSQPEPSNGLYKLSKLWFESPNMSYQTARYFFLGIHIRGMIARNQGIVVLSARRHYLYLEVGLIVSWIHHLGSKFKG